MSKRHSVKKSSNRRSGRKHRRDGEDQERKSREYRRRRREPLEDDFGDGHFERRWSA